MLDGLDEGEHGSALYPAATSDAEENVMKVGSLFSGLGGMDLGLERAGMQVVWQAEIDRQARAVLRAHWQDTHIFEDVHHVTKDTASPVDLICGGSPCQDVSIAGKRAGLAGERSRLFFEYHRILTELTPTWFVFENVRGLLSSNKGADFATVLAGFTGLIPEIPDGGWRKSGFAFGRFYNIAWRVLDAQYFGIAQRRKRLFIVGCLAASRRSAIEILFEREGDHWNPPTRRETKQENARVAGTLAAASGRNRGLGNENETDFLAEVYTLQAFGEYAEKNVASTLKARDAKDVTDLVTVTSLDVRNTITSDEISPTLQAKSNGGWSLNYQPAIISPAGVRRLTPVEHERLTGLPDGWTAEHSDSVRYRMTGNAVVTTIPEWVGKRIMKQEARFNTR